MALGHTLFPPPRAATRSKRVDSVFDKGLRNVVDMESCWPKFDLGVCRWIVKLAAHDGLPDAAVAALVAGCETPSLIRLAGMVNATWSVLPPVVASLFAERGRTTRTFDQAVKAIADDLLKGSRKAALTPERGPTSSPACVGWVPIDSPNRDLDDFLVFDDRFDLADQGSLETPEQVCRDVIAKAHALLARGGVRIT